LLQPTVTLAVYVFGTTQIVLVEAALARTFAEFAPMIED